MSALTREEWASGLWLRHDGVCPEIRKLQDTRDTQVVLDGQPVTSLAERHAIAAMCLHEQPYGFTWADVDQIRGYAKAQAAGSETVREAGGSEMADRMLADSERLNSLADRIEALLPPREGA